VLSQLWQHAVADGLPVPDQQCAGQDQGQVKAGARPATMAPFHLRQPLALLRDSRTKNELLMAALSKGKHES
ncbi:MAG: hypothetical protein RR687_12185, partial [Comamonas sp.]